MKIIAICGLKRSGKDTIANYISNEYGFKHVKIAQPLKDTICNLFDIDKQVLEDNRKDAIVEKWKTSPRTIMDFIGTHIFQHEIQKIIPHIERKFWIHKLLNNMDGQNIVISDLRFLHEYEELKKHNCLIIKVERWSSCSDDLSSEIEYNQIPEDIVLKNNGSISELYDELSKQIGSNKNKNNNINAKGQ